MCVVLLALVVLSIGSCGSGAEEVQSGTVTTDADSGDSATPPSPSEQSSSPNGQSSQELPPQPTGSVPPVLVGAWNGGPGDSAEYWLYIDAEGQYKWAKGNTPFSAGVAQVDGELLYLLESNDRGYILTWQVDQFGFLHVADQNGVDSTYVHG